MVPLTKSQKNFLKMIAQNPAHTASKVPTSGVPSVSRCQAEPQVDYSQTLAMIETKRAHWCQMNTPISYVFVGLSKGCVVSREARSAIGLFEGRERGSVKDVGKLGRQGGKAGLDRLDEKRSKKVVFC